MGKLNLRFACSGKYKDKIFQGLKAVQSFEINLNFQTMNFFIEINL